MIYENHRENQREFERDFYDLLRAIVERTPWRTEEDQRRWAELVEKLADMNIFGTLATSTTVTEKKRV